MEKREPSYTVGGKVNWCSHSGKQYRDFLKKLKIELPGDPAISLLGIHLEKTLIQKDTCTPGTSLVVQWLRLSSPNVGGLGSIPGQGTRSSMPQLKDPTCRNEDLAQPNK